MKVTRLLFAVLLVVVATALQAQEATPQQQQVQDRTLILVNGQPINLSQVLQVLQAQGVENPTEQQAQQVLNQLARQLVLVQYAEREGLDESEAVREADADERDQAMVQAAIDHHLEENPIAEDEIRQRFVEFADEAPQVEWRVRQILVRERDEAMEILEKLRAGEDDFSNLATRSLHEATANRGGELGWRDRTNLPGEVWRLVYTLRNGQVGGPLRTADGYMVVQRLADRTVEVPSYDEARDEMLEQARQARTERFIRDQLEEADIAQPEAATPQQPGMSAPQ